MFTSHLADTSKKINEINNAVLLTLTGEYLELDEMQKNGTIQPKQNERYKQLKGFFDKYKMYLDDMEVSTIHSKIKENRTRMRTYLGLYEMSSVLSRKNKIDIISRFPFGLRDIVSEGRKTISSEQLDVLDITQLAKKGKLDWIGIESSENEQTFLPVSEKVKEYLRYKKAIESITEGLEEKIWGEQNTDALLHLVFSARVIARAKNPDLFAQIKTVPLEDNHLKDESIAALDDLTMAMTRAWVYQDSLTQDEFHKIMDFRRSASDAAEKNNPISEEQVEAFLKKNNFQDEELNDFIQTLINATNKFWDLVKKRDKPVAEKALSSKGNGLIIMGSAHGEGIKKHLVKACEEGSIDMNNMGWGLYGSPRRGAFNRLQILEESAPPQEHINSTITYEESSTEAKGVR